MATEKIAMGINLRQNKNTKNAGYGKYYPEVDTQKVLSLRGFAKHLTDHGSIYGRDVVEGVLIKITECLPELVAQGVPVKLDGLGIFYPTAQVAKDAAVTSIAAMEGLNPNDLVKGIHMRFRPDSSKLDDISAPAFKEACRLEMRYIVDSQLLTINGKQRRTQTLKPITTAVAEWKAENGGSTPSPSQGGESLAAPTISGTTPFAESTQVTISGPQDATIHYTTDGSDPTSESSEYSAALTLSATTTVKAIAIKDGQTSSIATKLFTKSSGGDSMDEG
jgi:hypothetical protein